jgi:hypothetical protein
MSFLNIYKSMKVMLIKNLYPKIGIANMMIGYFQNIFHEFTLDSTRQINAPTY